MSELISSMREEMLGALTRIASHILFLIGYIFARVRFMGEFFAALVDSAMEGFNIGLVSE